ncbi:RNA polymerase subunit sigma [Mycobacterium sp. CBMA 234]|uniref:SigB/SigF/SigG family RNA polymerase sigma factor n=1 Tax=Mycolicibacterium sp. CBMA 234 TaxID=1918495 RepID=UPI0012DDB03C|nr:SigB/SigF/SigG family RNA polymerase sigma factor [Mycolicibacterium sp. CBMA 234]MUL67817.1 RNA polymerase subunit sigma [Mycolicibacterium sp. CBMA 234]
MSTSLLDKRLPDRVRYADEYADVPDMVATLRALPAESDEYTRQRERIVLRCCPLADRLARHFDGRGENLDDLVQVARVGLIQAVNRFDPNNGAGFVAFAVPTIMGELRRHFRDYGWKVHVPRSIRDIRQQIKGVTTELTQRLGRSPNTRELAAALSVAPELITEGLLAANAYQPQSLDTPVVDNDDNPQSLSDLLGETDEGFDRVTDRESVKPALEALPLREQRILYLRFFASKTQRQIADSIGVSQMHVSRILDRTLRDIREQVV